MSNKKREKYSKNLTFEKRATGLFYLFDKRVFLLLFGVFGCLFVFLNTITHEEQVASHLEKALKIEEETPKITKEDSVWMQESLRKVFLGFDDKKRHEILLQSQIMLAKNRAQLMALKKQLTPFFQEQPKMPSARQLQFALWELSKPNGVLDDCAILLRKWRQEGLFRGTHGVVRQEGWGREYASKVEKTLLFVLNVLSRPQERREMWIAQANENVQLLYSCVVPSRFQALFSEIILYSQMRGVLHLPNAGFVFGGNTQRGLDCVGLTNFVLNIPNDLRPRHMAFAWQKQMHVDVHPLDKRHWDSAWEQDRIIAAQSHYEAIQAPASQAGDVVVLMWEEPAKHRRHGHAFLILEVQSGFWDILECNRTNDKRRDGFARRRIPWDQTKRGIATYVLRPR